MSSPLRPQKFRIAVRKFPPFEAAIRAQWLAFEETARTGLSLDLVSLELQELEDVLFTSGGMATGEWDIVFVSTDWLSSMHPRGCAVNLRPLLDRDPPPDFPEGWSPSLLRLQQIDGHVLGVPYHDGPECLIYRRDLFDNPDRRKHFYEIFGRDLAPPRTWSEFHETARFFNDPSGHLYGTAFAAYPDGHNSVYDFLLQLWTRGGDLFSPGGELTLNTREARAALSFYREIVTDPSASHPDCLHLDSVRAGKCFASGRVAMMINWFGFAAHAHTSAESAVRGLVDVTCVPTADDGRSLSLNVYWVLSLAAGSPHPELGWKFLRHTQTPAMDKLTTLCGAIGCRRSTWRDPDVVATIPFYQQMETLHANAREIPRHSDWPQIASVIDSLTTKTISTDLPIHELLDETEMRLRRQNVPLSGTKEIDETT